MRPMKLPQARTTTPHLFIWNAMIQWIQAVKNLWFDRCQNSKRALVPVSQKSRKLSRLFQMPQFSLYLRKAKVLSHQKLRSGLGFSYIQRSAFQNRRIAFRQLWLFGPETFSALERNEPLFIITGKSYQYKLHVVLCLQCWDTLAHRILLLLTAVLFSSGEKNHGGSVRAPQANLNANLIKKYYKVEDDHKLPDS